MVVYDSYFLFVNFKLKLYHWFLRLNLHVISSIHSFLHDILEGAYMSEMPGVQIMGFTFSNANSLEASDLSIPPLTIRPSKYSVLHTQPNRELLMINMKTIITSSTLIYYTVNYY